MISMKPCSLYRHVCAVPQTHHICPESWFKRAGRPVDTPLVELCPTCHSNTHAAIDGLLRGYDISAIPPRARRLAQQALDIAKDRGLTPARTL